VAVAEGELILSVQSAVVRWEMNWTDTDAGDWVEGEIINVQLKILLINFVIFS
jgi:hypothetical protein